MQNFVCIHEQLSEHVRPLCGVSQGVKLDSTTCG
jgi:hypothetical protein